VPAPTQAAAAIETPSSGHSPLSQRELRTTSGAIALGNLEGEIVELERLLRNRPDHVGDLAALADRLTTRAVCLGRIADYERAAELGERAVRAAPSDPTAYLARARTRATLHRFQEAEADSVEAERRGARGPEVDGLRADLLEETGRLDEALALRRRLAADSPDIFTVGAEAVLRGRRGETDRAAALFVDAQHRYRDVSPFPYAWLYLQEGLLWSRAGNPERARVLWLAALERLPGYAPAGGYLAALEAQQQRTERAIDLLEPLAETSDDPEFWGQLAALYRATGQVAKADALRARAAARFDELVARHPAAFSAKAARFWLADGADPHKALVLARRNLAARQTDEDRALVAEAEAATARSVQ
jgi:tetratricopeptide (TPR) repeat protein